ncbi:MAG: hypothetical protein AAF960_24660, partial [Bacteroidota bacterium]
MMRPTLLFYLFSLWQSTILLSQNTTELLTQNSWSIYENFGVITFHKTGMATVEYAYCSACKGNKEEKKWSVTSNLLILGEDSLKILSANKSKVLITQNDTNFELKNVAKLKASKLTKASVIQHFTQANPLQITLQPQHQENATTLAIQFQKNERMWMDSDQFKGQWALKSFFGDLFLVFINRHSVNRDFPLIKLNSLKKGVLAGQSIRTSKYPETIFIEISK